MLKTSDLFVAVKHLIKKKAVHRKGYVIGDVAMPKIANHAIEEAVEIADAILNDQGRERVMEEVSDTFSLLVHLAIAHNISEKELIDVCMMKLNKRFSIPK